MTVPAFENLTFPIFNEFFTFVAEAWFRLRSPYVPNLAEELKYGKRAASESIWYGSFN